MPREDAERRAPAPGAGLARPHGHPRSRSARRCSPRARLPATAPQRDQPGAWPLPMPRLPGASHLGRLGPLNSGPGGLPRRVAQHPAARGLGGATSRPGSPGLSVLTPGVPQLRRSLSPCRQGGRSPRGPAASQATLSPLLLVRPAPHPVAGNRGSVSGWGRCPLRPPPGRGLGLCRPGPAATSSGPRCVPAPRFLTGSSCTPTPARCD